jgi:hypothetical protein
MVNYELELPVFLDDSYVKKKSYKSCRHKYPGACVLDSSTIFELVKEVR